MRKPKTLRSLAERFLHMTSAENHMDRLSAAYTELMNLIPEGEALLAKHPDEGYPCALYFDDEMMFYGGYKVKGDNVLMSSAQGVVTRKICQTMDEPILPIRAYSDKGLVSNSRGLSHCKEVAP